MQEADRRCRESKAAQKPANKSQELYEQVFVIIQLFISKHANKAGDNPAST